MTEAVPWVKWRFDKWRGDEGLRMCSLAARGLWIELIAIMHGCEPYGHLSIRGRAPTTKQIAGLVGMTSEREVTALLVELEENGVFSRSDEGLIFCRRLKRDNAAREIGRTNGARGGNPALKDAGANGLTEGVNPQDNAPPKDRGEREKREKKTDSSLRSCARDDFDAIFDTFWSPYPRKEDKGHARSAFKAALHKATPEVIVAGLRSCNFPPERKYQPLAATWLNGERWADEIPSERDCSPSDPTARRIIPVAGFSR